MKQSFLHIFFDIVSAKSGRKYKEMSMSTIPKHFHQTWDNSQNCNASPTIPTTILNQTLRHLPPGFTYKCHTLKDMQDYLYDHWGDNMLRLFNSYKKMAHRVDLWRYCILYEQGGIYMDADCVLLGSIAPLLRYDVVHVINNRGAKDIFNGFIMTSPGNEVIKEIIEYMVKVGTMQEDDYYFNCKELYSILERYINISQTQRTYESSKLGRMCLLVDEQMECDGRFHVFYVDDNGAKMHILVETNDQYPYLLSSDNTTSTQVTSLTYIWTILVLIMWIVILLTFMKISAFFFMRR
jgi:Glycosyltransferase sugar-binding region containing DXD motif